ncbi:unannotated protein [freshwater metagenome]|uniref:Unannotated protein n=1 Tax=freshwater metagenome TaxID=449393 RepID=A0A6J7C0E5_9ZZZZ
MEAQEFPRPTQRSREVDGPEDVHPRCRGERHHEDLEIIAQPLTLRAVVQEARGSRLEQPAHIGADRVVEALGAKSALDPVGPDDEVVSDMVRASHDSCDGHRDLGRDTRRDSRQLGPGQRGHFLNEDLEDAATGEPHRERIVVADAVGLVLGITGLQHLGADPIQRTFDTAAADRPDGLARLGDEHRGTSGARRRSPRPHDGCHGNRLTALEGGHQRGKDLTHLTTPRSSGPTEGYCPVTGRSRARAPIMAP